MQGIHDGSWAFSPNNQRDKSMNVDPSFTTYLAKILYERTDEGIISPQLTDGDSRKGNMALRHTARQSLPM